MAYGQPITTTLPTVGVTVGPTYATRINAFLEEVRTCLEAKVNVSGLNINGDVSFQSGTSNYRAKDLLGTSYSSQSTALASATYPNTVFFKDGELYVNDGAGNQIQITVGGVLNAAALAGISGAGYGANNVVIEWASSVYTFWASATTYAPVRASQFRISDASSNWLTLAAPSMASDYTVTFPAATPASTLLVQMSNTGTLSASNTLASGLTLSSGNITMPSGGHVTLSGTGQVKHGSYTRVINGACFTHNNNLPGSDGAYQSSVVTAGTVGTHFLPLSPFFDVGCRVISVTVYLNNVSGNTLTMKTWRKDSQASSIRAQVGSTDSSSVSGGHTSGTINYTLLSTTELYAEITGLNSTSDTILSAVVVYDRP